MKSKVEKGKDFLLMKDLVTSVPALSYLLCYLYGSLVDQICGNMTDSRIELVAPLLMSVETWIATALRDRSNTIISMMVG